MNIAKYFYLIKMYIAKYIYIIKTYIAAILLPGVDDSKDHYDVIMASLLEWIRRKITELDDREFPNTMDGIQRLLIQFGKYRTEEKPPKWVH